MPSKVIVEIPERDSEAAKAGSSVQIRGADSGLISVGCSQIPSKDAQIELTFRSPLHALRAQELLRVAGGISARLPEDGSTKLVFTNKTKVEKAVRVLGVDSYSAAVAIQAYVSATFSDKGRKATRLYSHAERAAQSRELEVNER